MAFRTPKLAVDAQETTILSRSVERNSDMPYPCDEVRKVHPVIFFNLCSNCWWRDVFESLNFQV
jgi:hypothetical protein